ncbi:hypothetical protein BN1723_020540, partial [Verticillium longisporum]
HERVQLFQVLVGAAAGALADGRRHCKGARHGASLHRCHV